jgi:hypothetical protein
MDSGDGQGSKRQGSREKVRGDADEGTFDPTNFDPEFMETVIPLPEEPVTEHRAPTDRTTARPRGRRDKLAWVPILAAMAAKFRAGGAL